MREWIRVLLIGAAFGAVISALFSGGIVVWEVSENPGGVFRTPEGWRWDRMLETGWSWFAPLTLSLAPIGGVIAALRLALRRARPSETP